MRKILITDRQKLEDILKATRMSRSELARALEVSYKTVYRWLDKGIKPHPAQSQDIDGLFKEHVDLRGLVERLRQDLGEPIRIVKSNASAREKFFVETTYSSNAIEGSRLTVEETEAAIKGKKIRGKEFFEILEAVNHNNALQFMLESVKPGFTITEEYALKLHSIVMYNFADKLPGKYRTGFVNVTNTDKALPAPSFVPSKMRRWAAKARRFGKDVLGKVSSDHYEFESIHPFFDGNGRVGRILLITQLLSRGYPPAVIRIEDRQKYYLALSKGDMGDFSPMVQMVCDSVVNGYNLLKGK